MPPWMMPWKPSKEDFPDLWIHPDHAVVLSVRFWGVVLFVLGLWTCVGVRRCMATHLHDDGD